MAKTISASLQAEMQSSVTHLTTIIEIIRDDGATYRMTNHSEDLEVGGKTYDHSIPFLVSANSSGTTLSVDNTELTLSLDGTIFTRSDFINGGFKHAEVLISLVDYQNPDYGKMIKRKGWFGEIVLNTQNVVKISVSGLLKLLDFEVGRTYTPLCDTDLGSRRCGVAIHAKQAYDTINPYHVGKWVKYYDKSVMTSAGLVNGDFSANGGNVSAVGTITGWTRGPDCGFQVHTGSLGLGETSPDLPPPDGSYYLWGGYGSDSNTTISSGEDRYIYQDIDCVADAGMSTSDIDNNKLKFYFDPYGSSLGYLLDPMSWQIDMLDANSDIIATHNTGWLTSAVHTDWDRFFLSGYVPENCRTMRVFCTLRIADGIRFNQAMNGIDLNWWDHTLVDPTNGVIHKCTRIISFDEKNSILPQNQSFEEEGGVVANTNSSSAITGWTMPSAGDYWQVASSLLALPAAPEGSYFLGGGDDSSGTQSSYEIENQMDLEAIGLDTARIDLGKYIGRIGMQLGHADATSLVGFELEFFTSAPASISVHAVTPVARATGWYGVTEDFVFPATARYMTIRLKGTSPVGDSQLGAGFDQIITYIHDTERTSREDGLISDGSSGTVFGTTIGTYTVDGSLIWKVVGAHDTTDLVATVTDNKQFNGTAINGTDGMFETAILEWVTGNNTGMRNIIRTFDSGTKDIKLYFRTLNDIQVGDTFQYILPCHKRFTNDCALTFDNAVNFQGFPHLPSKI